MANWSNITYQNENDPTDEVVIRHQGINYLQKRDVLAASISNARWTPDGNYKEGSEVKGVDNKWYVAVIDNGTGLGNATNPTTRTDDTVWKLKVSMTFPRNNDWNGYLDPDHTVPIEKQDTSLGVRSFTADEEIAPNLYVSSTTDVTFSETGISWLAGNSLYKTYEYSEEQLALLDINEVPVYIKDENGDEYFLDNSTNGVNVTKTTTLLKVEITFDIFSTLGISKLWRFFVTEDVGSVIELSSKDTERKVRGGYLLIENANGKAEVYPDGRVFQLVGWENGGSGSFSEVMDYPVTLSVINSVIPALYDSNLPPAQISAANITTSSCQMFISEFNGAVPTRLIGGRALIYGDI